MHCRAISFRLVNDSVVLVTTRDLFVKIVQRIVYWLMEKGVLELPFECNALVLAV